MHMKDLGSFRWLREFRIPASAFQASAGKGDKILVDIFKQGDIVKITGISKGKGFQGQFQVFL